MAADFTTFALAYCMTSSLFFSTMSSAFSFSFPLASQKVNIPCEESVTNFSFVRVEHSDRLRRIISRSFLFKSTSQEIFKDLKDLLTDTDLKISITASFLNLFFCKFCEKTIRNKQTTDYPPAKPSETKMLPF